MIANITEQLWVDYDLDTAVFLDTIAYWLKKNAANKQSHNFHEGRYWTYNSLDAYTKLFPGWSKDTIRRVIRNCVKNDLLIVGNFNRKGYDRTGWYSLTDKAILYYPHLSVIAQKNPENPDAASCGGFTTSCGRSTTPIPKLLPSSNINITISDIVEIYHEELPELPKVRKVDTSMKGQLKKMIKDWPDYQIEGKEFTIESFKNYLNVLKNNYSWFLKPYTTEKGHVKKCTLRKITSEKNLSSIVNGEFSAN